MRERNYEKAPAIAVLLYLSTYQFSFKFDISLVVLIIGGLFLLKTHGNEAAPKSSTKIPDLLILFFIVAIILHTVKSSKKEINLIFNASFFPATLIYIILSRSKASINYFLIIYGGIFISATLSSLTILLYRIKFWGIEPGLLIKKLPLSIFIVPNDLLLISISIPFIIVFIIFKKSSIKTVFLLTPLAACLASIIFSQSRSAIAVVIISSYTVFSLYKRKFFIEYFFVISLATITIGATGNFAFFNKIKNYEILCETRIPLWFAAWDLWSEKIIFGHGPHSYVNLYQEKIYFSSLPACSLVDQRLTPWPHNLYLELLSNYGIVGATPFFALIIWSLISTYQATNTKNHSIRLLAIGNFGTLIGLLLAALIELTLVRYWVVVFTFTIFGISTAINLLNEENIGNKNEKITN